MRFHLTFDTWPAAGTPVFEYAEVGWDSRTFGFPIFEIRAPRCIDSKILRDAILQWISFRLPSGKSCTFTKVEATNIQATQAFASAGFYVTETTLDIALSLAKMTQFPVPKRPFAMLRLATEADLQSVVRIAREAFIHDRFHLDPGFPKELVDSRYATWVEDGFNSGEQLYVFESTGIKPTVAGFYLLKRVDELTVNLSLAAVSRAFRQSGIGGLMYHDVLLEAVRLGYSRAESSISASNLDVVNLFARLGFGILKTRFCLHRFGE